jgi:hypothetical protein
MSVGVMENYKLRDLRASHTLKLVSRKKRDFFLFECVAFPNKTGGPVTYIQILPLKRVQCHKPHSQQRQSCEAVAVARMICQAFR